MIRAAGVVAALAGIVLLALLLHATRSVDHSATVLHGIPNPPPGPPTLHLGWSESRSLEKTGRLQESGITIDTMVESAGRERTFLVVVPKELEDAAKPDDELLIRSKRTGLWLGRRDVQWTSTHYELRRGTEVRYFSGPENWAFLLVFAGVVGGPLALWGVAAGIAGLARLRRGPSTSPPGSPGTPGSP